MLVKVRHDYLLEIIEATSRNLNIQLAPQDKVRITNRLERDLEAAALTSIERSFKAIFAEPARSQQ